MLSKGYEFDRTKKIGLSLHSTSEVIELNKIIESKNINIDYITLSHIFETKCKEGLKPRGVELLKNSRGLTDIKIVALGGILPQNIGKIFGYCDDFAVMSTLFKSPDVKKTIEDYNKNWNKVGIFDKNQKSLFFWKNYADIKRGGGFLPLYVLYII